MPIVRLGNHAALLRGSVVDGEQITEMFVSDADTLDEQMRTITHKDGLWNVSSAHDKPQWVWSNDETLQSALAEHYGCPTGEPADAVEKAADFPPHTPG